MYSPSDIPNCELKAQRLQQLCELAGACLPERFGVGTAPVPKPLQGDAGFRCYYRWETTPPVMLVDAPVEHENSLAFVQVASLLRDFGVTCPHVYGADLQQGLMVISDLGESLYQSALSADNAEVLYTRACTQLIKLQQVPERPAWLPRYSDDVLRQEMQLFPTWFMQQLLGLTLSEQDLGVLDALFELLVEDALQQPQVLVHRDFHCRNLITSGEICGVIDFQDAVWGPVTYDLVSLVRDCYVRWRPQTQQQWMVHYASAAQAAGVLTAEQAAEIPRWTERMGLQRHIKVLGIFARLSLRDGKDRYLQDLPLVLRYVLEALQQDVALRPYADWFDTRIVPHLASQHWYQPWQTAGDSVTLW